MPLPSRQAHLIYKLMKISAVQLAITVVCSSMAIANPNYAQGVLTREISLKMKEETLRKTLEKIEAAAHVKFVYSDSRLGKQLDERISITTERRKLDEILNELLNPHAISYTAQGDSDFILLAPVETTEQSSEQPQSSKPEPILQAPPEAFAMISGTVKDAKTHEPLAGVNVIVKGTTNGTNTDVEGRFTLQAESNDVLVISLIGYKPTLIAVGSQSVIDITLDSDIATIEEVVINAGYWQVEKKEQTGNISKITAEQISKQPVSNPLQALIGRMPGVYINQQNGLPGGGLNIQIRGTNSIRTDGNNPLYIVDGVPFTSTTLSSSANKPFLLGTSPFNSLNPSDIESIEILKDADATAIYGSRGSNGVVLITTKKGQVGKTKLDVNVYKGVGQVTRMMDLLSSQQYMQMRHEAFKNDKAVPQSFDYDMVGKWDTTRYTNWQKELIGGTAQTLNTQASVSGGDKNTQFLFGGGYYKESTVFPGTKGYHKASAHFNLNHTSADQKFKANLTGNFIADKNDLPATDLTGMALTLAPVAPALYDENGNLNWQNATWTNPLASLRQKYESNTTNLIANSNLSYEVLPGLQVKTRLGYTAMRLDEISTRPISATNPAGSATGSSAFGSNNLKTWIVEPQADYQREIGGGRLTVLLGTTFQQSTQESQTLSASGFTNDALIENIKAAPTVSVVAANYTLYKYNAGFGRINYNWKEKYLVNLTARRDGSSRFGPGKQFANFGAVGAAWIFSNEGFVQNSLSFLSFGKLRASYGTTGSDQIGDYGYLDTYTPTTYGYQGTGLLPTRLVNPDYRWETNKKMEAALELGFLKDRIFFTTSLYRNRSSNQLVGYSLPYTTGQSAIQFNLPAVVQNTGVEFELNTTNVKTSQFSWTSAINFTIPRNKLVEYPNLAGSSYANTYVVGEPLSIRKRLHVIGVDPQKGIYVFEDVNGNGSGLDSPADLLALKKSTQNFYGGFQNTIRYKGWQLDIFFQFTKQTGGTYLSAFASAPGIKSNQPVFVMDRWQKAGDNTSIQQFTQNYSANGALNVFDYYSTGSDALIEDASFIRLKNVSISYELPSRWITKIHLQNLKIYMQGQNLATITNYRGFDPETNQNSGSLPPLRIITCGIQFNL